MRTVEEALALLPACVSSESRERYRALFERFPKLRESAEHVAHYEPQLTLVEHLQ